MKVSRHETHETQPLSRSVIRDQLSMIRGASLNARLYVIAKPTRLKFSDSIFARPYMASDACCLGPSIYLWCDVSYRFKKEAASIPELVARAEALARAAGMCGAGTPIGQRASLAPAVAAVSSAVSALEDAASKGGCAASLSQIHSRCRCFLGT